MIDDLKLLDCPFCGAQPTLMRGTIKPFPGCANDECGLFGRYMTTAEWNRRAPTAEAELREALRFIASANLPPAKFARTAIETARAAISKGGG